MAINNQDYQVATVRSAAILTNGFVNGTTISEVSEYNQLILDVIFTIGSLTSAEVRVEFSEDNSTFIRQSEVELTAASGTQTVQAIEYSFTATGNYRLEIPIMTRFIRVSAQGTGTVTSSSMAINAIVGVR